MLRIAICDDEKLFRENIKKYVLKYLSQEVENYIILIFDNKMKAENHRYVFSLHYYLLIFIFE